jgi:hypothetical protein
VGLNVRGATANRTTGLAQRGRDECIRLVSEGPVGCTEGRVLAGLVMVYRP